MKIFFEYCVVFNYSPLTILTQQKTILHAVEAFSGGIILYIRMLTKHLHEYNHIILYGNREYEERGIDINTYIEGFTSNTTFILWKNAKRNLNPYKDLLALIELQRICFSYHPSIMHLHSSKAGFLGRVAGLFLSDTKIFYSPNGIAFKNKNLSPIKKNIYIMLEKIADKFSGTVICNSASEAECFKAVGIRNIVYINNGIDIEYIPSAKTQSDKLTIVTLARISDQKNPEMFSEVARHFKYNSKIQFIWIGDGDTVYKNQLIENGVIITGWLNRMAVFKMLADSDIYLSTSHLEGLPFSVLEAMSVNLPLVLSNCVGNVDTVKEAENGFLFDDVATAIFRLNLLIENEEMRIRFGEKSKSIVEKEFNAKKMVAAYLQYYTQQ